MTSILLLPQKAIAFADCWYWFVLAAVVCYFIGCFNFAVLISHFKKSDIRDIGSGNPGSMNMTPSATGPGSWKEISRPVISTMRRTS